MRIKLIVLFLTLITHNPAFSQNIEHLKKQLEGMTSWQKRLDLSLHIADTLMWIGSDIAESKKYAELALDICKNHRCGDKKAIARAIIAEFGMNRSDYTMLNKVILPSLKLDDFEKSTTRAYFQELAGVYSFINGDTRQGITRLTVAQQILEKDAPSSKRLSNVYIYLAYAHNMNSTNDSSILFMKKSINHAKLSNDTIKICDGLSGLNTLYSTDGNYAESIKTLLEAKKLAENSEIAQNRIFLIYDALIHIYIKSEYYDKAEKELEVIIPKYRKLDAVINAKASTMWSYFMSYSLLMKKIGEYERGIIYVDSAYVYAGHLNKFSVLITDLRKAGINLKLENYELSHLQMQDIFYKAKQYGQADAMNAVLVEMLAELYMESPIRPSLAFQKELLLVAERIVEKNKGQYNLDLLSAKKLFIVFAIYRNDVSATLESLSSIMTIRDSIENRNQQEIRDELFVKYETENKNKQLAINELKLSKQATIQNTLVGGMFALLLIIGVLALFFQQKRRYATLLEQEVAERTADLQKSNQALTMSNEELERYTYIASHDLKEPLRNIVSFIGILKRKNLIIGEDALHYFGYIEKGAYQMNDIVKDILEFSNLRKNEIIQQQVSIPFVIEHVKQALQNEISEKNVIIETYNLPNIISTDESMIFTVFKNLIENAIKFNENPMVFIKITYLKTDNEHVFKVQDNGIGIEEAYHEQVFEMFKRLHDRSKYKGSGIELAICRRTIGYLKGSISVSSNADEGVTFTVTLPLLPERL